MTLVLPAGPVFGVNGPLLRKAAGLLVDMESAEVYDVAVMLGVSEKVAGPIWQGLVDAGYISAPAGGRCCPTLKMTRLAAARFGKMLSRAKAESLLRNAVDNAKLLNAMPDTACFYYVTKLVVFGSYLEESKQELGDLDIAWETASRPGNESYIRWCICSNVDSEQSTRGVLRPKGPYVRLVPLRQMLGLGCPYRVVYEIDPHTLAQIQQRQSLKREQDEVHRKALDFSMSEMLKALETPSILGPNRRSRAK